MFYIFEFRNKGLGKIYFHDFNTKSALLHRRLLKRFLFNIFKKYKRRIEQVDIIFCTDRYLRNLNKTFLNHHYNTDTVTFILSDPIDRIVGEVYISVDRVKANAKYLNENYQNELIRVVLHSCLHLCGFQDKTKQKSIEMTSLQEKYLNEWIVSRETQIGRSKASW